MRLEFTSIDTHGGTNYLNATSLCRIPNCVFWVPLWRQRSPSLRWSSFLHASPALRQLLLASIEAWRVSLMPRMQRGRSWMINRRARELQRISNAVAGEEEQRQARADFAAACENKNESSASPPHFQLTLSHRFDGVCHDDTRSRGEWRHWCRCWW